LSSCGRNPTDVNLKPVIQSLVAFPPSLGPGESTTVVCGAIDRDGDVLVYDWITDGKLIIQGTPPNQPWLYTTSSNRHVFYPDSGVAFTDSARVQCYARDQRGESANRIITIHLHR
jgi:hypothetical protein